MAKLLCSCTFGVSQRSRRSNSSVQLPYVSLQKQYWVTFGLVVGYLGTDTIVPSTLHWTIAGCSSCITTFAGHDAANNQLFVTGVTSK